MEREIANEDALNFVIADAAVHPAKENNKLRTEGQCGGGAGQWCRHVAPWVAQFVNCDWGKAERG